MLSQGVFAAVKEEAEGGDDAEVGVDGRGDLASAESAAKKKRRKKKKKKNSGTLLEEGAIGNAEILGSVSAPSATTPADVASSPSSDEHDGAEVDVVEVASEPPSAAELTALFNQFLKSPWGLPGLPPAQLQQLLAAYPPPPPPSSRSGLDSPMALGADRSSWPSNLAASAPPLSLPQVQRLQQVSEGFGCCTS